MMIVIVASKARNVSFERRSIQSQGAGCFSRPNVVAFRFVAAILSVFALSALTHAQQSERIPRIGLLYASAVANSRRIEAFRHGLRELGYVEGKNIRIEYRYAEGQLDRYPVLAADLVRLNVDVIVTGGPAGTLAAKEKTSTIPIVMAQDDDPVDNGFVVSLARPGGNITGLSTIGAEISGKQVEFLKDVVPGLARLAVVGTSSEPANRESLKETELAARALGIHVQYLDTLDFKDFKPAFRAANEEGADAVLVLASFIAAAHAKQIANLASTSRLPAIYAHGRFVRAGGLMSYGVSFSDLDRRAATYVDKILKGAKPADLPVERARKFELVINLKAAKQIGLEIPPNVLARADSVIQ